jgi:NADPH:quinone reductase-like Zn-dependent oxidoreductase
VVAVGDGVTRVAEGDRVCPIFVQKWYAGSADSDAMRSTLGGPLDGTLRQSMVVDAESVVKIPDYLSDAEAAALPCAAVTAWSALHVVGGVEPGDVVVAQGTGGVSIFTLQLAQLLGARVIVTSSSDEKLERARSLGAWQTINYREEPEWGKKVKELTGGRGADHVVEVGGAETLSQSLAAVAPFGEISVIGILSGGKTEISVIPILMQNVRLQGIFVGHRQGFESLLRAMAEHELRPVVDAVFPLAEVRDAFEHMKAGKHFGKICIDLV